MKLFLNLLAVWCYLFQDVLLLGCTGSDIFLSNKRLVFKCVIFLTFVELLVTKQFAQIINSRIGIGICDSAIWPHGPYYIATLRVVSYFIYNLRDVIAHCRRLYYVVYCPGNVKRCNYEGKQRSSLQRIKLMFTKLTRYIIH